MDLSRFGDLLTYSLLKRPTPGIFHNDTDNIYSVAPRPYRCLSMIARTLL